MSRREQLEMLIVKGIITATSDKVDPRFASTTGEDTKTIYVELDGESAVQAKAFGLREYVSKEDGKPFFIIRSARNLSIYDSEDEDANKQVISGIVNEYNNFESVGEVGLAISKGKSDINGQPFYRVFAILGEIQEFETTNPFA